MRQTLFFTLLILSANLIGFADAQSTTRPAPPETVIGFVQRSETYATGSGGTNFDATVNFTFTLSPQDGGTFTYRIWSTNPANVTTSTSLLTPLSIPGRIGWRYLTHDIVSADSGIWTFNLTTKNPSGDESAGTCVIHSTLRLNQTINQCGENPTPPVGLSAVVTARTTFGSVGNLSVEIAQSPDDIDANWTHILIGADDQTLFLTWYGRPIDSIEFPVYFNEFDADARNFPRLGDNLTRTGIVQPLGLGLSDAFLRVSAYDNLTRWQSLDSCEIAIDIGKQGASSFCGSIAPPNSEFPTVPGGVGTPQFPLVDLVALAVALNASESLTGMAFGFALVGVGAVAGIFIGIVPAILLATTGLALGVALNLLPPWWLVIVFMAALSLIIFRGGKE